MRKIPFPTDESFKVGRIETIEDEAKYWKRAYADAMEQLRKVDKRERITAMEVTSLRRAVNKLIMEKSELERRIEELRSLPYFRHIVED